MISHEILKRAAAVGALGAAALGGAVWMGSETAAPECECDQAEVDRALEVSGVAPERLERPVVRRAPPPEGTERAPSANSEAETASRERAADRARKDAMRRAVERLARLKRMRRQGGDVSEETVRRLEERIDRAVRAAIRRTKRE